MLWRNDVMKSGSKLVACYIYDMGLIWQSFDRLLIICSWKCFIKGIFNPHFWAFQMQ